MTKLPDVLSIADLRRKAHELVRRAQRCGRPVLITQRGRGAAVLVSVDEWERREERRDLVEAILNGERDFAEGRVVAEKAALRRLRAAATHPVHRR